MKFKREEENGVNLSGLTSKGEDGVTNQPHQQHCQSHINKTILDQKEGLEPVYSYMGEGNANLVITNKEKDLIIRLPKSENEDSVGELEHKLRSTYAYMDLIVRPVLGDRFVVPNTLLTISSAQLQLLRESVGPLRPAKRKHKDVYFPMGLVMPNLTSTNAHFVGIDNPGPCISVEIKPKSGIIIDENTPHASLCNFCLKQHFKHSSEKVRSEYCPLGLFSGNLETMNDAILALLQSPQNNIRIFGDGNLLHDESTTQSVKCLDYLSTHTSGHMGLVKLLTTALTSPYMSNSTHKVAAMEKPMHKMATMENLRHDMATMENYKRKLATMENGILPEKKQNVKCRRELHKKIPTGDLNNSNDSTVKEYNFTDETTHCAKEINHESSVLSSILKMQSLNVLSDHDIKGIYEDLLEDGLSEEDIHNLIVHQSYQGAKHKENLDKLLNYMLHTTAQDLSIFIIFMKQEIQENPPNNLAQLDEHKKLESSECIGEIPKKKPKCYPVIEMNGFNYLFSIKIIDLDAKPVSAVYKKIEKKQKWLESINQIKK